MKTFLLKGAFLCFLALFFTSARTPQSPADPPPIFLTEFMKPLPGKTAEYIKAERQVWKKLHQKRKEKGNILGWYFYQVLNPVGTGTEYDYVTVTIFKDLKGLDMPDSFWEELLKEAKLSAEEQKIIDETERLRNLVRGGVTRLVDGTVEKPNAPQHKYAAVNWMKVPAGQEAAYSDLEIKTFKPYHQECVNNNKRGGWALYAQEMPWGSSTGFSFLTVDYFDSLDQLNSNTEAEWTKVNGKDTGEAIMKKTNAARELVKGELWKLLDSV